MQNVAKAPAELKFRKLRLSNPKITAAVIQTPGALRALQVMGWEANVEEDTLVLPSNRQISFAQVTYEIMLCNADSFADSKHGKHMLLYAVLHWTAKMLHGTAPLNSIQALHARGASQPPPAVHAPCCWLSFISVTVHGCLLLLPFPSTACILSHF